ncbi:hypothetical protein LCGC14_1236450 [marine sediment metagenome]|uniref:Uncharacterized protein n=1 Tax=marine sediment metagenome TaxID=412755 RepID=A0A0F9NP91_9ZZZZ
MNNEITIHNDVQTAEEIKAQVTRIQQVMQAVMKNNTHYGVIPGTHKPTLYKAGSEVLLSTFRISVEPEIDDLSTGDEIRYRIRAVGRHQTTSIVVGIGVGECSSNEEKYKWRDAICDEEFDSADEDRRRIKYQRQQGGGVRNRYQIRTEPSDIANTILKMAKKRAQIDMTLTALAASDIFTQDAEDLPESMRPMTDDQPRGKPDTQAPQANGEGDGPRMATNKQIGLVRAKVDDAGIPEKAFFEQFKIGDFSELKFDQVNAALAFIKDNAP